MPIVIPQTIKAEHVLGAAIMFVHPGNGNRYYGVCEKQGGTDQNFVVYRRKPGQVDFEFVYQLDGAGRDATAFITMGGAVINVDGSLEVWASGQPVGQPDTSGTGFDAIGAIVPNVDDPWVLPKVKVVQVPNVMVELNHPDGFDPYGGADKSHQTSNETVNGEWVHYFSQCGRGPKDFGVYVFRQVGNQKATYVWYNSDGPLMTGRGDLDLDGDGTLQVSGSWSDKDEDAVSFPVPGYVPFANNIIVMGGGVSSGGASDLALVQKVAMLEQQLGVALAAARAAMDRANYVKGVFDPVWEVLSALEKRPVGISKDEAWQLAINATFGQVTTETATRHAIEQIVQAAASKIVVSTTDGTARRAASDARQIASEAHETATTALAEAMQKTTPEEVIRRVQEGITSWLEASIAYTDRRLLNLIWDRGVKLARFLKVPGADKAPINIQDNINH